MNLPIYNCLIDESTDDESGIYAISFVDAPANETDFIALARQPIKEHLNKDTQKQILTGVVLRPDQLIYRNDARLGEYYIKFSAEQIEKIAQKMMRTGIALHNTTHQHNQPLLNNYMTELWIIENPEKDKSNALGFDNLPKGTLMCSYKIEDTKYWQKEVMTGNVKGFSLEGLFFQETATKNEFSNNKNKKMNLKSKKSINLLSRIAQFFLDIQSVEKSDATASGTAYVIFILPDGKEVYVDADGFATLDGEQLPAGEHTLADGNTLVVDEQGQFIETKENIITKDNPEQATAPEALSEANKDAEPDSVGNLKAKIADLESKLSELAGLAKEANTEVQKLRQQTPSTMPLSPNFATRKKLDMKRYEQMAQALSFTIKSRK